MAIRVLQTHAGTLLDERERELFMQLRDAHGRVTVLVPSFAERDLCHRSLADAGCGMAIDVQTPRTWSTALWELLGDGRQLIDGLGRRMVMEEVLRDAERAGELAPLRANPGTVRMMGRMAAELLPFAVGSRAVLPAQTGGAQTVALRILASYAKRLESRGYIETSSAAVLVAKAVRELHPACARAVVFRGIGALPAYLQELAATLSQTGDAVMLVGPELSSYATALVRAFEARGCTVEQGELSQGDDSGCAAPLRTEGVLPTFLEVAGPHARARAYTDEVERLVREACAAGASSAKSGPETAGNDMDAEEAIPQVVVVSARSAELFDEMAPRLAARGMASRVARRVRFANSVVGSQVMALQNILGRMDAGRAGTGSRGEWWPAPELVDWLYAPVSGAGAEAARAFDKKMRSRRDMDEQLTLRELQSVQARLRAARKKMDADNPWAAVPAACSEVVQYLAQKRPVSAFKALAAVVAALPASAWASTGGAVRAQVEADLVDRALVALTETARGMKVSQEAAFCALEELSVVSREAARPLEGAHFATVVFLTMEEASQLAPGSVDAMLFADVDTTQYPLAREEGPAITLAAELGAASCVAEPAARLSDAAARALAAARVAATFARITHDRQAKDNYPAALWTSYRALVQERSTVAVSQTEGGDASDDPESVPVRSVGEGELVHDLDTAAGSEMRLERVACLPPQELTDAAVPYVVLKRRQGNEPGAPLVPRQFSASQIEMYTTCPLCWFVSSRVRPARIDAGFGNMEKGNFVHDVMERFHERLPELGFARVNPENVEEAIDVLREVFKEVRQEHARGKTSSSAALIAHTTVEQAQIDAILPQLEAAVRYEAWALTPFVPRYLEYSFNDLEVEYAGWPLGGRIDRVDVDAEGRAVIIDYKHRSDVGAYRLADPTVPDKDGVVPADDPLWLPEHTQALIYAQALRRALGLDMRGALYFATKGRSPVMRGAVSAELAEVEPRDGRVPGLRAGFPAEEDGGTMDFQTLLDRVEAGVGARLARLAAGDVHAGETEHMSCSFNHALGFTRRDC